MQKALIVVVILVLLVLALYAFYGPRNNAPPATTSMGSIDVYYFDVGQGDAALIDYEDYECLIDAGDGSASVANLIAPYVQGPLEDVVASHPHADHIGGLPGVFARYEVSNYWWNGDSVNTQIFKTVATDAKEAKIHKAHTGETIHSDNLSIVIIQSDIGETTNNKSIVVEVKFGASEFLFTGDTEQVTDPHVPNVEFLKVAHHGSCEATSPDFLAYSKPKYAIYSAGAGNEYGHPCPETLARLTAIGATIYGTDKNGTIKVTSNGTEGIISVERG